jgi:beta-galactosidase
MISAGALIISVTTFSQQANNDWENPQLFEVNKEAPHATFMLEIYVCR